MPSIRKVEHGPEIGIRIRLGDLIEWSFIRIDDFVNGRANTGILDCPSQISRGFAFDDVIS
jgi:hypothetical protein